MLKAVIAWIVNPVNLTAVSTVIIAAFTVVLAVVSWHQAKLTRTAVDAAKHAADAANQQASSSVAIELPILMIVSIETLDGSTTKLVRIKIRNYGRTPAIITAYCLETRLTKALPINPHYSSEATFPILRDTVIERGAEYDFGKKIPLGDAEWEQVRRSEMILWAYGYIDYINFQKREHRDGFCVAFLPVRKTAAEKLYDTIPPSSLTWVRTGPADYTYSRYKTEEDRNAGLSQPT